MAEAVIVGYARTPIGRLGGGLAGASAVTLGGEPLGRVLATAEAAGPDATLHHQPAAALAVAAGRAGVDARALDVYEINEAFAAVTLAAIDELGLDEARVNPEGGAVALCGGGGQGEALLLETLEDG